MSTAVIDASVVLRWAFEDEADREGAERIAANIASGSLEVVGPPNFLLEVAAALVLGIRTERMDRATADDVMRALAKVAIAEGDAHGFAAASYRLALDHGIRVPDAAYIEIAMRAGATLISGDQEQLRVAAANGVAAASIAGAGTDS